MFKELELSETDSVLAAYNAVCDLVEETERLQAACAAKEAELAELRGQTAELFGARLEAEGIGEEAVTAAKVMWQRDPQSVAMATLGCDIVNAANPYGCNQYGHEWKGKHGEGWKPSGRGGSSDKKEAAPEKKEDTQPKREAESLEHLSKEMRRMSKEFEKAQEAYRQAREKVFDLDDEIEKALRNGDPEKADQLKKEQEEGRSMWKKTSSDADRVAKEYSDLAKRWRAAKYRK